MGKAVARGGFTLIELLISSALAMLLAAVAVSTFYQVRQAAARAEAGMAMCDSAQTLYAHMHSAAASLQQSCALAAYAQERSASASMPENGEIRLVFMRGKEEESNYVNLGKTQSNEYIRNDLAWEMWLWRRADKSLSIATNSNGDEANPGRNFVSGSFSPIPPTGSAVNYNSSRFYNTPQPRRTLDWTSPMTGVGAATALGFLDDNVMFPDASGISMASPQGDIGDYTDLQSNLVTVLRNVSEMSLVLVAHDGTATTLDDADASFADAHAATGGWDVRQGVWLDGRMLTDRPTPGDPPLGLADPSTYASSPLAKRPVLLRVVMTLTDPRWNSGNAPVARTFTYSFALPGLAGPP